MLRQIIASYQRPALVADIARAAVRYASARRQVARLPRKMNQDDAAKLFDAVILAEDELLRITENAGDDLAGEVGGN